VRGGYEALIVLVLLLVKSFCSQKFSWLHNPSRLLEWLLPRAITQ
jgi:hypothetical protein